MIFKKKEQQNTPQHFESTQKYLEIDHIRDDILVMKDGSLRTVLTTTSINMDLRSDNEQGSIIASYQNALNSLEFPLQLLVQSRKVDLTSYLATLETAAEKHPAGLLKDQTNEYIAFLRDILSSVNVMDKRFYIVIPFYPNVIAENSTGVLSFLGLGKNKGAVDKVAETLKNYSANKEQLSQRTQIVIGLFSQTGMMANRLPTEALIELFYACYNPETAGHEHLRNLDSLGANYVTARGSIEKAYNYLCSLRKLFFVGTVIF